MTDSVGRWRKRDLSDEPIKYLFLGGVNFDMRVGKVVDKMLAKVPRKLKKTVADDLRSIFYTSFKGKALEFFNLFKMK